MSAAFSHAQIFAEVRQRRASVDGFSVRIFLGTSSLRIARRPARLRALRRLRSIGSACGLTPLFQVPARRHRFRSGRRVKPRCRKRCRNHRTPCSIFEPDDTKVVPPFGPNKLFRTVLPQSSRSSDTEFTEQCIGARKTVFPYAINEPMSPWPPAASVSALRVLCDHSPVRILYVCGGAALNSPRLRGSKSVVSVNGGTTSFVSFAASA